MVKKEKKVLLYNVPLLRGEAFQSGALSLAMVMEYFKKNFKLNKENYLDLVIETSKGGVFYASRYGIAYAATKRGLKAEIYTTERDEGFAKFYALELGKNLNVLRASFEEVKQSSKRLGVKEKKISSTRKALKIIKESLKKNKIPIAVLNGKIINSTKQEVPVWVVINGYNGESFFINDPIKEEIREIPKKLFEKAINFRNELHIVNIYKK
jgi:predicted double-glycine peptidase